MIANTIEIGFSWDQKKSRYIPTNKFDIDMKLKRATMYINKIAKSIKVEEVVILSASKKSTPTVYYAKVFLHG